MKNTLLILIAALTLNACYLKTNPKNQGQMLRLQDVEKVKVGMSKEQVLNILGTPLLQPITLSRFDYIETEIQNEKLTKNSSLIIYFKHDIVTKIDKSNYREYKRNF